MKRRTLIATLSGAAAGFAGCLATDAPTGGPRDDDDPDGNDDPGAGGFDSTAITTVDADCAGDADDRIEVTWDPPRVVIDGRLPAPHPCHEAALVDAAFVDGEIDLVVDVESTLDEGEGCMQCLGQVDYQAELTLPENATVDAVTVRHETGGVHRDTTDASPDDDRTESVTLETIETGCGAEREVVDVATDGADDEIRLTGTRQSPNPCHAASIREFVRTDGEIFLLVGVTSTLAPGDGCVECEGTVQYEVSIRLPDLESIEAVRVEHDGGDAHRLTLDRPDAT